MINWFSFFHIFFSRTEDPEYCLSCKNGLSESNSNNGSDNRNGDIINEQTSTASASESESRRHNSMDRLMSLLNDMGHSQRTRSLSDGNQEEGTNANDSLE